MENLEEDKHALGNATAVQLDPLDFAVYERNLAKVEKLQILAQMYERELLRTREELAKAGQIHTQHATQLYNKYNVDLHAMIISDDGFFVPHTPQQPPRR